METPKKSNESEGDDESDRVSQVTNPFDEEEDPIDDDEFNIPAVDFEPTLESILSHEDDNHSLSDEEGHSLLVNQNQLLSRLGDHSEFNADNLSIASRGSSDNKSRGSSRSYQRSNQTKTKPNIMRYVLLKGMTSQLNSAGERNNVGTCSAICLSNLIGIGTTHGFVLVFDSMQTLRFCFGESQFREAGGSVSSLAINPGGTRMLVGYAKGLILMYNLENGKLLRVIQDAHANSTAVLILRFTDNPHLAMCSDSGGSVFELNFNRNLGKRGTKSKCIFSGSRGEVCTFEPLNMGAYPDNPLNKFVIAALATLSKVIVVCIRPKLKVLFTHPLTKDPTTLPLLAWQMVIIQTASNDKIVDPVLTFARENEMFFYQITLDGKGSIQFIPLQKISLNHQLLSIHWLNSRTMALLDTKEKLRILDVRSQEELEVLDLSQTKLVYATSHFKGIVTGGNVSKAFALAGEKSCYNSILCMNNQIVVLGTKCVHALTIRNWNERLEHLAKQHQFLEALALGHDIYTDKAKAVTGLRGSRDSKRNAVREKCLSILNRLVERIPILNYMEDLNTAKQNYTEVISACVKYYVLFFDPNPIFEKLCDLCSDNPICRSVYLESLEPFILNDSLRGVPPIIVKEFITYYEELGNFKALEASIVHFNVDSLDIHQTMKLCWTQGLYDAIIYIYNQGMNDYISPMEELMTELRSALAAEQKLGDDQIFLGNKILVYISCCLCGRAYPYGNIPTNQVEKVQSDIFRCITSLHTKNHSDNEQAYPYLRALLAFDTREFLNVLSLSFEEYLFDTELGKRQKQRIIDILLQVMVDQGSYTPTQVGVLFTFLARQMAKKDNTLHVSKLLFEQVLEHLTSVNESQRIDERQQALLELLEAGGIQHFDPQKLLEKCLNAKFFRVCEMLYERKQEYEKIIDCYIYDQTRSHQIFSFLHKIFSYKPGKRDSFLIKVKEFIEELVKIDNKKTAQILFLHLPEQIPQLNLQLRGKPEIQYSFLQGIFSHGEDNQNTFHLESPELITENYIELLCKFNPSMVHPFLKLGFTYRIEQSIEICSKYKLIEAWGYLLEKDGRPLQAFDLLMDQFGCKLEEILKEIEKNPEMGGEGLESHLIWVQLQGLFLVIIQFSQRNSSLMLSSEREKLWLPLLELIISAHNKLQGRRELSTYFNDMTKHLLSSMMGHVSLPTIVEIIMNDSSYEKATFAETRDLITGMLETCTYEEMMVSLVNRITQTDVFEKLQARSKVYKKGLSFKTPFCSSCQMPLLWNSNSPAVILFNCGHALHQSCTQENAPSHCIKCRVQFGTRGSPGKSIAKEQIVLRTRNRHISVGSGDELDEYRESSFLTHAEFELKLEAPTKIILNPK